MVLSLNHVLLIDDHVVTKVVESELVIRSVGNIGIVGIFLFVLRQTVNDKSGFQSMNS